MSLPCQAEHQAPQPVLSIRLRTPVDQLPQRLGQSYQAIMEHLASLGEQPAGAPFVAYYNMDMQDLDIEVGFPVARQLPGKDPVKPGMIAEGLVATCTYQGPYQGLSSAYQDLTGWVSSSGYTPTGTTYEFYLNDPTVTPPEQLLTRIVFPLQPQ